MVHTLNIKTEANQDSQVQAPKSTPEKAQADALGLESRKPVICKRVAND
jgi:hypothetical protein